MNDLDERLAPYHATHTPHQGNGWRSGIHWASNVIDLREADILWAGIRRAVRRAVRP